MLFAAIVLGVVGVAALIGLVYVVGQAVVLKSTAEALQAELKQFKEGGFDRLITNKLAILTQAAVQELQNREKVIKEISARSLEEEHRTREAAERFKTDLGDVRAKINSLQELQGKVGELNDLLKPQQLRGELGEVIVRTLIADKLPPSQYEEEHTFADGKKVEFAIRLDERLIPVDSKLQLEGYKRMREAPEDRRQALRTEFKRAIRQKIDEVRGYIKPEEGTYHFALMVIPSEAVYYELIANKDFVEKDGVYDYARSQDVFLVSPLTFWAYLTVIAQGLHGMEVGRRSEEILSSLQSIASHIQQFASDEFRLVGDHLRNAQAKYDAAQKELRDITDGLADLKRLKANRFTEQGVTVG